MIKTIIIILIGFSVATLSKAQTDDPKLGTIKVRKYSEQQFYIDIDYVPKYVNGADALLDDIQKGINYPEQAEADGISGVVLVNVVIDKLGNVVKTSINSSPAPALNKAALMAAKSLKKFEPHRVSDMEVSARFVLPIKFIL